MAGYAHDFSKSNNAHDAERNGRYPLTHAIKVVAKALGCTQAQAKEALTTFGTGGEYHHTGSWYNCTDYYDTTALIEAVNDGEFQLPEKQKAVKGKTITFKAVAEWTDWGGSRNYPRAYPQKREVEVVYKEGASMLTLDGARKKLANIKLDGVCAEVAISRQVNK